jgi:hypothetical protein
MLVSAPELASVGRSKVKDPISKSSGFLLLYMYIFSVLYKELQVSVSHDREEATRGYGQDF